MSAYGLRRYVARVEEPVSLDDDGFLNLAGGSSAVAVADLPTCSRHFALLAPGGAGKTTTTAALAQGESSAGYVETPLETRSALTTIISAAAVAGKTLYFDAVDECVNRDPVLLRWLARELERSGTDGGRWRLSCRSVVWDPIFAELLPDFATWKLLPLDRSTAADVVEEAMGAADFDGTAFIDSVAAAGLGRLSGCVRQLVATARFWHGQGVLPETAVEAIDYEVTHLLEETNSQHVRDIPADRTMRVARRMAAFELFTGTQAYASAAAVVPGALVVDRLPSEAEPVEPARSIEPADYRAVLGTSLFGTGPAGAVVFQHQSYVEYLAAAYLVERKLQPAQVPALLGVHADGQLPSSRIGVAAWLGALQPELVEMLVRANARLFASSGPATELPSDTIRAAVVAALLDQAVQGEIQTEWKVDPALLVHPNLGTQLRQSLTTMQRPQHLWWIARLAAAGHCVDLVPALATAAADTRMYSYARHAAAVAVGELGDDDVVGALAEILEQDSASDSDHQLRATVIDLLYPRFLSTPALLAALRPCLPNHYGHYDRTLDNLADRIPVDDLPAALDWLRGLDGEADADLYGGFPGGLLRRAWDQCDDIVIRRALAQLLVEVDFLLLHTHRRAFLWDTESVERRRSLVLQMVGLAENSWMAILSTGLLRPEDVTWVVDQAAASPSLASPLLAWLIRIQVPHIPPDLADRLRSMQPDHPAYEATQFLRGRAESSHATTASTELGQSDTVNKVDLAADELKQQARTDLAAMLNHPDTDPDSWWHVPLLIRQAHEGGPEFPAGHDLTSWPGWDDLQPDDQATVIDTGIRYLDVHTPNPESWAHLNTWSVDQVFPDWAGVYLLATLVRRYPNTLAALVPQTWRRWMSAIVAVPAFNDDDSEDLRGLLVDAVPAELQPELIEVAIKHLDALHAGGGHLLPREVYVRLTRAHADRMADWLLAVTETSPVAEELLAVLVRSGQDITALDLCRRLRALPDAPLAASAERLLPELDPNGTVDELISGGYTSEQVAVVASRITAVRLDQDHVFTAARFLLDAFPYRDDPPLRSGFIAPAQSIESTVRELRSRLLGLLASDSRADELSALLTGRNDLDRQVLHRYLATARSNRADLAVTAIRPQALLDLLRSADARLVRDDADFLTVILHQLDRIQHDLTHTSAFREIWDGWVPQSEDSITDWLQRRLSDRLHSGVVVDREIQVKREKPIGVGTRIDCVATTITETKITARVLFEAKLANSTDVLTAMRKQLIDRYLIPQDRCHGILIVYWIHPDRRPRKSWTKTSHPDKDGLLGALQQQADAERANGFHIAPVILDITPPEGFAGTSHTGEGDAAPDAADPGGVGP